jgi:hypothetical protein
MTSFVQASAKERIVVPSITSWTRLEPRPRDATMARSLQAQVRDPLWMLTRQWQLGEYAGSDTGSPVQATMGVETQPLTGYRAGLPGAAVQTYDPALPLEVHVEHEAVRFNVRGAVQLGQHFEALVRASGVASPDAVIAAFRAAFPIAAADPNPALAGQSGLQLRALSAGKVTNGETLYASAVTAAAGGTPDPPLPPEAIDPSIAPVIAALIAYRQAAFIEPGNDPAWQSNQLTYAFAVESASPAGPALLEADDFIGGHLDWYDFSTSDAAPASAPQEAAYSTFNFLPMHVTFRGMPGPRWWIFEDGTTDFGQLDTEHVDLAKMLVMEFALVYGGDWFFVPVPTPVGSLQRLQTLVVTDTFGERTLVRPVEQLPSNTGASPWTMFRISGSGGLSDFVLIAPTLGITDDADPLEDVLFLRDNVAAMAWGIEQTLQGAIDLPVDGYEQYLVRLRANPPAPPAPATPGGPQITYELEQPVPDNWIPLVPVLNAQHELLLRRGTMDVPTSSGVIKIVPHGQILEPWHPFYLTERVVTQIGVEVSRALHRTRWTNGSTYVWMGRLSHPGSGPGWSGLRFDFVRKTAGG